MKSILVFFLVCNIVIYAQQETEIIGVNYNYISSSSYQDNIYNNATNKLDAFVNYGHDLGKKTKLFYHISYQNFDFKTKVNYAIIPQDILIFPKIPNYSLLTLASGMTNKLKNNLKLTNIFTFTFANGKEDLLKTNNYFRTFSYLKKKKTDSLSYGLGLYTDNVKGNIRFLPIVTLELKNTKRGFNLFFPRSLKLWQKVTEKSYVELKTNIDSNTLLYNDFDNLDIEILSITNDVTYNYIFNNKYKLKAGLGLPIRAYNYKFDTKDFETSQKPALSFIVGFSYVVFQDN